MEHNIKLSLVQTSQDRRSELVRFVNSLNAQQGVDFSSVQLIFYDQGQNDDVFEILNPHILLTYIKGNRCSLSKARNICLPEVKGIYVAFPDDDCWYEPDTLRKALSVLQHGDYEGVTGKGTNEKGQLTSVFPSSSQNLTREKRCGAISYTLFFKFCPEMRFDEAIGVGSPYNIGAGEETDYLLSLMEKYDYRVYYDSELIIHHPILSESDNKERLLNKCYSYARGSGFLMQKHKFSLRYKLRMFIRPLIGMIVYLLKGNLFLFKRSYYNFRGRWEGYYFKI